MNFNVIFVSGVHGVGKSTICERVSKQFTLPHFSASTLIKDIKNGEVDKNKVVVDAEKNQDYLILALDKLNVNVNIILIDGHFCLQGEKDIVDVPLETFKEMNLAAVILLKDEPSEIYARMLKRDGGSLEIEFIHGLQEREKERAKYVSSYLEVPYLDVSFCDSQKISEWLKDIV